MVVNKVIKTPLGYVELGMLCGKIVWCGFASVGSGSSVTPGVPGTPGTPGAPDAPDAAGDAGTSGAAGASEADRAQKGIQMCPEEEISASREQNCRLVCPSGAEWAQKDTQMCPEEGESAAREQKCRLVCPEPEERMPEYSLDDLLRGRGSIFRWEDLQLQGTPLQMRVWRELFNLLPDELVTYSELASRCGYPRAVRAVATAVGKNPVSLIIPCHRVVRKSGYQAGGHKPGNQAEKRKSCSRKSAISAEAWELGNYRWGSELKKRILEWEGII
ncbi:MAG: methylated-DNA--[Bacteroidales bacterium]|nr:methylated-DNA--[protein]-cysteine S-methyltransferase [Bacteroidales bacterium]